MSPAHCCDPDRRLRAFAIACHERAMQGIGGAIWAARYLTHVKELGGEVVVECRKELAPLMRTMAGVDQVVLPGTTPIDAQWHVYLCSLPGLFTPDPESIPSEPCLKAPADRMAKFALAMARAGKRLKVGIVWSGSTSFRLNHERAVPFARFREALAIPGVQLYSLQKGPPAAELTGAGAARVIDLAPLLEDFADTAVAVSQLDLVIMTDSAVAHVAGALGKPVWVLLGFVPYWLWLAECRESPWYATMRLFRQLKWGDWGHVLDLASSDLLNLTHCRVPTRVNMAEI